MANRVYEDTAEKPTHLAIGTDTTAEDAADVNLGAQISTRQTFNAGWPADTGGNSEYNARFLASVYSPNDIGEVGLFTGAATSSAVVRTVFNPKAPIPSGTDALVVVTLDAKDFS